MAILTARNVNRSFIMKDLSMAVNQVSDIIDWSEMAVGSIQVAWSGNDTLDGKILVEVGNIPEDAWFDTYDICEINDQFILADDGSGYGKRKTKLFNLGVIGFRYTRVTYLAGTNTSGVITAMALGKKNG